MGGPRGGRGGRGTAAQQQQQPRAAARNLATGGDAPGSDKEGSSAPRADRPDRFPGSVQGQGRALPALLASFATRFARFATRSHALGPKFLIVQESLSLLAAAFFLFLKK